MFKYNELSDLKNGELVTPLRKEGTVVICLNANDEEEEHVFSDFDIAKKPEERIIKEDEVRDRNDEAGASEVFESDDDNDNGSCSSDPIENDSDNSDKGGNLNEGSNEDEIGTSGSEGNLVMPDNGISDDGAKPADDKNSDNNSSINDILDDTVIFSPTPNIPDNILDNKNEEQFEIPNVEENLPTLRQLGYRLKTPNSKVNIETRTVCVLKRK